MKLVQFTALIIASCVGFADAAKSLFEIKDDVRGGGGGFGEIKMNGAESLAPFLGSNRTCVMNMGKDFKFFNSTATTTGEKKIFVHYNGVVSFDQTSAAQISRRSCPDSPTKINSNLIAVYWMNYNGGNVRAFKHTRNNAMLSSQALDVIADDLTRSFGKNAIKHFGKIVRNGPPLDITKRGPFNRNQIEEVVVITWENMYNNINTKTLLRKRLYFQLLFIKTKGGQWYAKVFYEQLGANVNADFTERSGNTPCGKARIGLGIQSSTIKPQEIEFEYAGTQSSIFQFVSNEYHFSSPGSYSFDLNCDAWNQPTPPDIKCDKYGACAVTEGGQNEFREQEGNRGIGGGTERPTLQRQPTTRQPGSNNGTTTDMTTTTLSARQEALNRFCRFRDDGPHPLVSFCDVFIYCAHNVGSYEFCKNGTKFNPEVLGCDHGVNFECSFSGLDVSSLQTLVTQPPALHNNLCYFRGYGELPDPLTCDHYYACTNSRSIRMPCPAGLFFKPNGERSGTCEYPRKVNCKNGDRSGTIAVGKKPFHPRKLN